MFAAKFIKTITKKLRICLSVQQSLSMALDHRRRQGSEESGFSGLLKAQSKWVYLGIIFGLTALITVATVVSKREKPIEAQLTHTLFTFSRDPDHGGLIPRISGKISNADTSTRHAPSSVLDAFDRLFKNPTKGDLVQKLNQTLVDVEQEIKSVEGGNERLMNISSQLEENRFDASEVKKLEAEMKDISQMERQKLKKLQLLLTQQDQQIRAFFMHHHRNRSAVSGRKDQNAQSSPSSRTSSGRPDLIYKPMQKRSQSKRLPTAQPSSMPTNSPTTAFKAVPLTMEDIAFAVIGDRNKLYTWQLVAPNVHIISTDKKQPFNFVVALRILKLEHPNVKWYVVSDDDVFFFVGNLLKQLEKLDPRQPFLIGSFNCRGTDFVGQNERHLKRTNYKGWVHGGPGIVFSKELLRRMDLDCCIKYYSDPVHWPWHADDVVATTCAMDYWPTGRITHFPGFFSSPPGSRGNDHRCECPSRRKLCTYWRRDVEAHPELQVSYHHVNTYHTADLFVGELDRLKQQGFAGMLPYKQALLRLNNNRRKMVEPRNLRCPT